MNIQLLFNPREKRK